MMNQEFKARWLAKLREPGRVQGTGMLRSKDGEQCCLDLACEITVEDGIIDPPHLAIEDSSEEFEEERYVYSYTIETGEEESNSTYLPVPVRRYLGLKHHDPSVFLVGEGAHNTLSYLNDSMKKSFLEIADLIEADKNI